MKQIIGLLFLLSSLSAFAQELTCLDKLLPYNRHSGLHLLTKDEYYDGKDILDTEGTRKAINFLVNSKLLCKSGEVIIKVAPVCALTIADIPQSNSCFVFTNIGYFKVSRDNGRNLNIVFAKDKRYSEPTE